MKQKFCICKHCGNIISVIRDKGVPVYCCSEKIQELALGTTEASAEKHIPVRVSSVENSAQIASLISQLYT